MSVEPIDSAQLACYYDDVAHIVHVTYKDNLTPDVTIEMYKWLGYVFESYGVETVRGAVFDFRPVTQFSNANLGTTQRSSQTMNKAYDMSHIPVALLVKSLYQEQMVRAAMRVTPQENRKRIVHSPEKALTFIEDFHRAHPRSAQEG